jgi:DNA-directed RNA polymerase subunit RPC12/RpoP
MIFFGSRGKTISGEIVEGIQCPHCEKQEFITFGIMRYFHLYWIPMFLTSRVAGIECTHCKKTLIGKEIPKELSQKIKATVFTKKKILPMFSGLIILACFVLFMTFSVQQDSVQERTYIEQPAINDLYIVDFTKIFEGFDSEYNYGIMRIKNISSGQVEFQISQNTYSNPSAVLKDIRERKITADSYADNKYWTLDVSKLKVMKETKAIDSIERL